MKKIFAVLSLAAMFAVPSFAVQTPLTPAKLKVNTYAVQAGDLAIPLVAMDAVNGNSFVATGSEILIFQNPDASAHTVTISSVPDELGRTDTTLTSYSIPASGVIAIEMNRLNGWVNANGLITLSTNSALVKVAVLVIN